MSPLLGAVIAIPLFVYAVLKAGSSWKLALDAPDSNKEKSNPRELDEGEGEAGALESVVVVQDSSCQLSRPDDVAESTASSPHPSHCQPGP